MEGLNRREFLLALGAFGVVGRRVWAEARALGYPDWWAAQVARVAERVSAHAKDCPFGFWFLTDPHVVTNSLHAGELLAALGRSTPVKAVHCGGDIPGAFAVRGKTEKESVDFAIDLYRRTIVRPVESAGLDFFPAKGNHDFTVRRDPKSESGFTYSEQAARDILMDVRSRPKMAVNADDPTACYYYVDHAAARFRVIVADTTDSNDPSRTYWAVRHGMGERQLKWLAEKAVATIPDGWNAVVIHHIPLVPVVGAVSEEKLFAPFRRLLEAYVARSVWTGAGVTLDFAKARGRILLDLTGHHHAERQTYRNGLLHLTEPCDARYGDYIVGSTPWCADLPDKTAGTPTEHTFDALQFDLGREVIRVTRVGGGADRVIHLKPTVLTVGETRRFAPEFLKGVDFFGAYDGDRNESRRNPKNRYQAFTIYFNDHLGVASASGEVKGLSAGSGIVLARNAAGEKEIWPVDVRAGA